MEKSEDHGSSVGKVAPLLWGSGMCALIYQLTWTREFRLIFGASTAASAAVLAIFIGGLGVGGVWLGKRADGADKPLLLYARLEALVALLAASTPLLLWLARRVYLGLGGTTSLGMVGGTVVRLLLAVLVLAGPTVAMGGTLPAAARAVESHDDVGRRYLALLYGVNTFGAVCGSLLANFVMLEVFGARLSLWMACLVNLLVAVVAIRVSREVDVPRQDAAREEAWHGPTWERQAPPWFVLIAAAVVGFAFFLMELVWYRMLAPLLGGTVFTFGLILAVALLGIGLGGLAYAFLGRRTPPTLGSFALTCLLEGLLIILPYALGDRVALLALTLREVGKLGFSGYLFCWSLVTGLVVLPAAFVSGVQFPMLIALLGQGKQEVGRQIGWTYAWNTGGAILGSLAGGFGLLPLLGVRGCWRLMAVLLAVLGGATLVLALRTGKRSSLLAPGVALLGILVLQGAQGPTALWRHAGIGAGRFTGQLENDNDIDRARNEVNQELLWETDGIESSVGIRVGHSYSFLVNGKSDGNALSDAGTQIMLGLLGVVLKPEARSALVIGLGTGSSGGWLGAVPSMERVDIVEIEPAIREVARRCAVINQNVLDNPKVHLYLADAREVLQTTARRYDLIVSEPSNPYRAGIASLYTKEFYQAANARLSEGGLLLQWVQGYEISAQTLRTIYATLHSVFPHVETWVMDASDLLLVATHRPQPLDASRIRQAIQQEPLRSALAYAWRVNDLEGVLAHFVANHELASVVAREEGEFLNVDDLSPVEFGFARAVGKQNLFSIDALADLARRRGEHRPAMVGEVDWSVVENRRFTRLFQKNRIPPPSPEYSLDQAHRLTAMQAYIQGRFAKVVSTWGRQSVGARETNELTELMILGHSLAEVGNENAWSLTEKLALALPLEALMIRGHLRYRQKRYDEATDLFEEALLRYRKDPWVYASLADRSLQTIGQLGSLDPKRGLRLLDALSQSFAVHAIEKVRLEVAFQLSLRQPDKSLCIEHLRPWEPFIPWEENFLKARFACYQDVNHPLAKKAEGDLLRYLTQAGMRFEAGLTPLERPLSPRSTASSAPPAPLEDPSSVASAVQTPASFAFPPLPSATATAPHP